MKTQNIIIIILLVIIYRLKTNKPCFFEKWICGNSAMQDIIDYDPIPREEPSVSSFTGTKMSDLNDKYV